jgi:hypothetical protein
MGEHDEVTPHLARSARHPLPKGEGCISDFATSYQLSAVSNQGEHGNMASKGWRLFADS